MDLLGLDLRWPIIGAPMAGGPSTVELASAVSRCGGLGFLAAGYLSAQELTRQISELRMQVGHRFGVNVFCRQDPEVDDIAVGKYLDSLANEAIALAVETEATWDDDDWELKIPALISNPVAVVSFTFGLPEPGVISELKTAGSKVMITVTTPGEADKAVTAGADALCAQGIEAGGHQGTFSDDVDEDAVLSLADLLSAVCPEVEIPVIAAGGIMTNADVSAVLKSGAAAAQIGTALLLADESGTNPVYRSAIANQSFGGTAITRAFSGRRARGLVNDFMRSHPDAPSGYPQINNATRALRKEAVRRGDPQKINLWAGTGFRLARKGPAAEIVTELGRGH